MSTAERPPVCSQIRVARETIPAISQEEAARRLGVSVKAYRAYESFREPSLRRLREIAAAFGLPERYFLESSANGDGFAERIQRDVLRLEERVAELEARLGRRR